MIVPMVKVFAASRRAERDRLLGELRRLGVMHLIPARPEDATGTTPDEDRLADVEQALQLLSAVQSEGMKPDLAPSRAAREVLDIRRRSAEGRARLDALRREIRQGELWGDVRMEQLLALYEAGVELTLYVVPDDSLRRMQGEVVQVIRSLGRRRKLVAAVTVDTQNLPPDAVYVPPPARDRNAIKAEAAEVESALERDGHRLARLARLRPELRKERDRLRDAVRWANAVRSGLGDVALFAVQGWVPADVAPGLAGALEEAGLTVAIQVQEPREDDAPPTLLRAPAWARPMQGLLEMLGMVPGYDEPDVSGIFIVSLPLFAGMIIGDAGYGLLFLVAAIPIRRLFVRRTHDPIVLLVLFGIAAVVWGAISGVWFGVTPEEMVAAGGVVGTLGGWLEPLKLIRGTAEETRTFLIKLCFVIGSVHLIIARIRRATHLAPDPHAIEEAGWAVVLAAMLGLIWVLFFGRAEALPAWVPTAVVAVLAVGLALAIAFRVPEASLGRRIGLGIAGSLMPLTGAFSDTLSYIRLMAVGLASYYLGSTFNTLAAAVADAGGWVAGAPVLVFGHALNVGLILIAIFAHGLRLNVLEFSSNAGIRWSGYRFQPFTQLATKEH